MVKVSADPPRVPRFSRTPSMRGQKRSPRLRTPPRGRGRGVRLAAAARARRRRVRFGKPRVQVYDPAHPPSSLNCEDLEPIDPLLAAPPALMARLRAVISGGAVSMLEAMREGLFARAFTAGVLFLFRGLLLLNASDLMAWLPLGRVREKRYCRSTRELSEWLDAGVPVWRDAATPWYDGRCGYSTRARVFRMRVTATHLEVEEMRGHCRRVVRCERKTKYPFYRYE